MLLSLDHFSGNYQGGNVPPDLDSYSKSVGGDTPGDGRIVGVQSRVSVSLSPRSDGLIMQADRGGTIRATVNFFSTVCSERLCLRACPGLGGLNRE